MTHPKDDCPQHEPLAPARALQAPAPSPGGPAPEQSSAWLLLLTADAELARALRGPLETAGYQLRVLDRQTRWQTINPGTAHAAALIVDLDRLQEAGMDGIAELRTGRLAHTPLICLADQPDLASRLAAYRAGAVSCLGKPVPMEHLLRTLAETVVGAPVHAYRVLLVQTDRGQLAAHTRMLRQAGMTVLETDDPLQVPGLLAHFPAETLMLDLLMPDCSGPELAAALRDAQQQAELPIVYLSNGTSPSSQAPALSRADDQCLNLPVTPSELVALVGRLARNFRQTQELNATLRSSEERLRRGQAFANIGTWDWNIGSDELHWSERIAPLFGHAPGSLETRYDNFLAAIHPDDRQAVMDAVNACVEQGVPYDIEHRVVWPDGSVRWLQERGAVTRDASGKPSHMLGVVQDVHARKQIEMALTESEAHLSDAQALARLGYWRANAETGAVFCSPDIYRILGRDPARFKLSLSSLHEAVHPEDRELVRLRARAARQTGIFDARHRIVQPDGSVRHVHGLARIERGAGGQLLSMAGTIQDMSEFMEAKEKLRQSEERLTFAVEGAGDGIWDWNLRTGQRLLSGCYETMRGYDPGELSPTIEAWLASIHPNDRTRVQQALQAYLDGKLPVHVVEQRLRCKDGSYKWILCRGTVVARNEDGRPVRMIGIHSDIHEQKLTQEALLEARENAERSNKVKSNFLSSMSHELRTPMNAILGFAQILKYDSSLTADQQENVAEILAAGGHLLQLINEVLDLAKIESGHIELSLDTVPLHELAEECQQLMAPLMIARQLSFSLDIEPCAAVCADRFRLKQVLLNLLSNAIKYNRETGSIRLTAHPRDIDRLRICISDNGSGIPAHRIPELFQPFNRLAAESSAVEGTGIGLTIARQLIELMGGQIGVESHCGTGTTFWIELQAVQDS